MPAPRQEALRATSKTPIADAIPTLEPGRVHHLTGVLGAASAWIGAHIEASQPIVVVAKDGEAATRIAADLSFLLPDRSPGQAPHVQLLLPSESSPYADVSPDRRASQRRLATLFHLARGHAVRALVTTLAGLSRKVLPPTEVQDRSEVVEEGQELDRDALVMRLTGAGYLRVPLVEDPGSFAVRGAILDLWSPSETHPVRLELYGDLVLSVARFDPDEQRTLGKVESCWIAPAREEGRSDEHVALAKERLQRIADDVDWPSSRTRALIEDVTLFRSFFGAEGFLPAFGDLVSPLTYLDDGRPVLVVDPTGCVEALRAELERTEGEVPDDAPHFPASAFYTSEAELAEALRAHPVVALHRTLIVGEPERALDALTLQPTDAPVVDLGTEDQGDLRRALAQARKAHGKVSGLDPLAERMHRWKAQGLRTLIAARNTTQAERLVALLRNRDLKVAERLGPFDPKLLTAGSDVWGDGALVVVGGLAEGAIVPGDGLVLVTEEEIFESRARRRDAKRSKKAQAQAFVEDLRSLSVGDYVVHVEHGIGRYVGMLHRSVDGIRVDLLTVEYAGGDKLYLPVYRLNQIQKHGGEDGAPKLDRLGGQTFAKVKARAKKQAKRMADELLRLYAERQTRDRTPIGPVDDEYQAFEATFPFEETEDQAAAIADVNQDLEVPAPMDRLVCGDVGFGKTEVAIRAAFRMANAGYQVAVLCPTTLLAQQHFHSFQSRMRGSAIELRALSRFQNKAEQAATSKGLRDGTVDIVVGTHRILSKDIHFKRLGLLVIDEEQRFGVTHKERIKQLKTSVDVLTLSATPIPRTLQMAISGIRDLSLINTAPTDRRAVRTIVCRQDPVVLTQAIERELERGGQIFYVYNRVEGLYERAARLEQLVPRARICVAHGQLSEAVLERTMVDFVEGQYDILAATAIIESGLDIPRANTIIIDRADMFGLAQLYQLRGRVGRSTERGYCYLVVPGADSMSEEARSRIEALERHSDLGSGFQIASMDLELRGAGDLLGAEQSGTAAAVGFELYSQMLRDAVSELRGEPIQPDYDPELTFDCEALLPDEYIDDVGVRLTLYKRLASAPSASAVDDLASEMEDRFGPPPVAARQLVHVMRLKTDLRRLCALGCEATARSVSLHLSNETPLDERKLLPLLSGKHAQYKLTPDMRLTRRASPSESFGSGIDALEKMLGEVGRCMR